MSEELKPEPAGDLVERVEALLFSAIAGWRQYSHVDERRSAARAVVALFAERERAAEGLLRAAEDAFQQWAASADVWGGMHRLKSASDAAKIIGIGRESHGQ